MFRRIKRKECVWKLPLLTQAEPPKNTFGSNCPTSQMGLLLAQLHTLTQNLGFWTKSVRVFWPHKLRTDGIVSCEAVMHREAELVHRE